jgi:hypothetical protein
MRKVETKEGTIESHPEAKDNQAKAVEKAKDLKVKGYTLDDIRKAGALETELVSDKPTTEAGNSTLSRFNPEAVKSLETAFEDLEMKEGEENAVRGEQREPDVIIGQTDLVNKPSYKGNDLIRTAPREIEQPADIKEQVFISSLFSEKPIPPETVKAEQERALQGLPSIRDTSDNNMTTIANTAKEESLMKSLGESPEENAKKVKDFIEIENTKPETKKVKSQVNFYDALSHDKVIPENAFVFLNNQVRTMQAFSTAASLSLKPDSLLADIGEILIPIYGELIYVDFQNALAEGKSEYAMQLLAGNTAMDNVAKKYWSTPPEGQAAYLTGLVEVLQRTQTSGATDNDLLKLDIATKVFEKILEGPDKVDEFTYNDAINFTENLISEVAVLFPLVKVIKDSLKMRKISRLTDSVFYNTIEAIELKKSPDIEGEFMSRNDPLYPNGGTGTALDIVVSKNTQEFKKLTSDRDIKDVTDSMGVSPADMPRRILPRMAKNSDDLPQPDGIHHTYLSESLQRKIDSNHLAQQLQKEEIDGLLPAYVLQVSKDMGETTTPHLDKSFFEANPSSSTGSLGTFVVRMGESKDGGFKTAGDARNVVKKLYGDNATVVRKTPYGRFSDDLMEGVNGYGDYFIEIRQVQQTTPLSGNGMFLGGEGLVTGGVFKPLLNQIFDDDLLFNDKIQQTYSNIRDRANAFGMDLEAKSQSLFELSTHKDDLNDFNMLSTKMQDMGIDEIDLIKLTELLGRSPSQRTIDALKAARNINSANWYIKNDMEYALLSEGRYKTTAIGNERYISKPLLNKPEAKSLKGTRIYDPESKTDLPLNQNIVDGLYEGGGVVATLYKPVKTPVGEFTQIIVRRAAEDIKPLQKDVVPYVKGHYQTSYKDDGHIVLGIVRKKVDGISQNVRVPMGISKNIKEANLLAAALANRGAKLPSKLEDAIQPTREYARRHNLTTSGAVALEMSIERGERLKGFHGEEFGVAEVLDPYDAYIKTLYKTRNKYEQPTQSLMKQRFMDMNKDILSVPKFPVDINIFNQASIFKNLPQNAVKVQDAISFHRRIRLAEGGDLDNAAEWVNSVIRKSEMWAGAEGNTSIEAGLKKLDITKAQALASGLTNVRYIWGNALYQIMGPIAQTPFLLAQGPVTVAKSLYELMFQFVPLVMAQNTDNIGTWHKLIAAERGVDVSVIKKEMEVIIDSGIVRTVGAGQDYQTDMSFLLQTLMENKKTRGTTVAVSKALSLPIKLMKGSVLGAMDMFELLTFFIAKNNFVKANKGSDWMSPENLKQITYEARGLSLNQNDTARLGFQNADNPLKMAMALHSYVARLATRQYADTITLGFMSSVLRPKGSRNVNPHTKTKATALGGMFIGGLMFGAAYFDPLDLDFGESQKEYLKAIAEGRFDKMLDPQAQALFKSVGIDQPSNFLAETYYMGLATSSTNALFDGDVDWNEKYTTNSYIKSMYNKITGISTENALDSILGLPYVAAAGSVKIMIHNAKMIMAMEDLDSRDALFAALEFASQLKLVDDAVAIHMATNIERRVSKSTFSPKDKTTMYEQTSQLIGGVPYSAAYANRNFKREDLPRTSSDTFQNYMMRKTQFELNNAFIKKGDNLSEEEASEILIRNFRAMIIGEPDLLTDEGIKTFRSKIVEIGKPIKIGGLTIDRSIQEKGISVLLYALQQETPAVRKERIKERLGLIKLQIQASPQEVSLVSEKDVLESALRQLYGKTGEELNDELLEEVTN